jgi:hypothetical protein
LTARRNRSIVIVGATTACGACAAADAGAGCDAHAGSSMSIPRASRVADRTALERIPLFNG